MATWKVEERERGREREKERGRRRKRGGRESEWENAGKEREGRRKRKERETEKEGEEEHTHKRFTRRHPKHRAESFLAWHAVEHSYCTSSVPNQTPRRCHAKSISGMQEKCKQTKNNTRNPLYTFQRK